MATFKGTDGVVLIGANAVAELKSYTVDETADTIEDSVMGDTWRTRQSSLNSWSGSAECFWDDTDTNGQVTLTVGSSVTLSFQPEGNTTGDYSKSGTALVTAVNTTATFDGYVEASFSFEGNGALTIGTVA